MDYFIQSYQLRLRVDQICSKCEKIRDFFGSVHCDEKVPDFSHFLALFDTLYGKLTSLIQLFHVEFSQFHSIITIERIVLSIRNQNYTDSIKILYTN